MTSDFDDVVMDCLHRTFDVRGLRCGEGLWQEPPVGWPAIVKSAWPSMYFNPPAKVPDGWIDVMLAMSEHLAELAPGAHVVDAFEDHHSGGLSLKVTASSLDGVRDVISGYEAVAARLCRVCGGHVRTVRRTGFGRLARMRAVCDKHVYGDTDG